MDQVSGGPSRLDFAVLSAKLTGVALASYVPLNAVKLLALRAAGALGLGRPAGGPRRRVRRAPLPPG
jgi:hypothetical protein